MGVAWSRGFREMGQDELQSKLEEIASPLCGRRGLELVQVQVATIKGEGVLRLILDRPRDDEKPGSGVDIDDCSSISRELSAILDESPEILSGPFRLEVSSPGLERPLVKLDDYLRFEGREAVVKTRAPIEGQRTFRGTLAGVESNSVRVDINGSVQSIPFEAVVKAHLVHRF